MGAIFFLYTVYRMLDYENKILITRFFFFITAKEQEELQKKYDALKEEVDKRDREIRQLQQNLKDAENILVKKHFSFN